MMKKNRADTAKLYILDNIWESVSCIDSIPEVTSAAAAAAYTTTVALVKIQNSAASDNGN